MITSRAAILLAAGAVPVAFLPRPEVVAAVIVGAVFVLSVVDILLAAALTDLRLAREGDRQVRLGERARVTLTVTNHGDRGLRAEVRDAWVPSAGAIGPRAHRIVVGPGSSVALVTDLFPTRRGDRAAVRVSIRSYGPLRLGYRQQTVRRADALTPQWSVRVLPPFTSRRFLPERLSRLRTIEGLVASRGRGQGTEFDALREYVLGDDVRSIDWRGSARASDVMVRTWRPERDRRVVCVLDTGRTCAVRVGGATPGAGDRSPLGAAADGPGGRAVDEPRLDTAIDAALLLASLANLAGDRVDLLAIDTVVRAAVGGGSPATLPHRLAGAVANLRPALTETDFGLVVGEIMRRVRGRCLVVLFTALEPGALGDGLLPVLAQLTSQHKVLVAAVHDPALGELAARRGDAAGVYAAAAAHRTLAERHRIATALARNEVEVVDAPAGLLAPRVADAYLDMKAAGRL